MRWVVPGVTATALGFETVLSSFFVSILRLRRRSRALRFCSETERWARAATHASQILEMEHVNSLWCFQ